MRLRIYLHSEKGSILPAHHQYELSSWVYKTLAQGDSQFARWLHSVGYQREHQNFKFFTCSSLFIPDSKREGDRLFVLGGTCHLDISFLLPEAGQHFVQGLFQGRSFVLGDRFSAAHFRIGGIQRLPDPVWKEGMEYRLMTPALVKMTWAEAEGRRVRYLGPEEEGFEDRFFANLVHKYSAFVQHFAASPEAWPEGLLCQPEEMRDWEGRMKFCLRGEACRQGVRIKAHTRHACTLYGYRFGFELLAPVCLQKIAYHCGVGGNNSLGFGCLHTDLPAAQPVSTSQSALAS